MAFGYSNKNPCTYQQYFQILSNTCDHICWLSGDAEVFNQ